MAQRVYTVSIPVWNKDHMAELIVTATGLTGVRCFGDTTEITVDHVSLTVSHDVAIQGVFSTYIPPPVTYGVAPEVTSLKGNYDTLHQWSLDAAAAVAAWDGQTTAQRFATLKVVVQRLGIMMDKLGDHLKFTKAN